MSRLNNSPIPLYYQISAQLEAQIKSGELKIADKLPNEKQLATDFGVSLITVRAAMRVLLDKRLVTRYAGKGTFVAAYSSIKRQWAIGSLDDLIVTGMNSRMRLIWRRRLHPPLDVARKFGIEVGQAIFGMRTIRETDAEPFMITDTFHPPAVSGRLKKADFTSREARSRLVISVVERILRKKVQTVRQAMSVEAASHETGRLLGVKSGEFLLVVDREYFTDDGELIQIGRTCYRTDNYRYIINVSHIAAEDMPQQRGGNVLKLPLKKPARAL